MSTARIALPPVGPRPSKLAPVLWASLGAAVASIVFLVATPARTSSPQAAGATHASANAMNESLPAPTTRAPERAVSVPRPAANAPVAAENPVTSPAPAPAAVPASAAVPAGAPAPAAAAPTPVPAGFDPKLAGQAALERARPCFTPERLASGVFFGAGVLYAGEDGSARRVFHSATDEISMDEKRCVSKSLIGLTAGGAPGKNTIVEYSFRIRTTGGDVKVRPTPKDKDQGL